LNFEYFHVDFSIILKLYRTSFFLYTPENGAKSPIQFEFGASGDDLLVAGFHPERPTKILSHGWNSNGLGFCEEFVQGENLNLK
jgi:hypothetical protein